MAVHTNDLANASHPAEGRAHSRFAGVVSRRLLILSRSLGLCLSASRLLDEDSPNPPRAPGRLLSLLRCHIRRTQSLNLRVTSILFESMQFRSSIGMGLRKILLRKTAPLIGVHVTRKYPVSSEGMPLLFSTHRIRSRARSSCSVTERYPNITFLKLHATGGRSLTRALSWS